MEIKVTQENGRVPVTVLHLNGDLDSSSYEQFEALAQQAIANGACYMLLDMTKVPFMSSAGIRAIYKIFTWLRNLPDGEDEERLKTGLRDGSYKSRRLKLLNISNPVQKALATAGMDMFLEIHHNEKEAVNSF